MVTFWEQLSCTASTPVFLTCGYYQVVFLFNLAPVLWSLNPHRTNRFYPVAIQIWKFHLPIFLEKWSPLPGFEPSRYATNWAILAWILKHSVSKFPTPLPLLAWRHLWMIPKLWSKPSSYPGWVWVLKLEHNNHLLTLSLNINHSAVNESAKNCLISLIIVVLFIDAKPVIWVYWYWD